MDSAVNQSSVVRKKPMWSYNHNAESKIFCLSLVPLIPFPCKVLTSPTMVLPFVGFFNNIISVNRELPVYEVRQYFSRNSSSMSLGC